MLCRFYKAKISKRTNIIFSPRQKEEAEKAERRNHDKIQLNTITTRTIEIFLLGSLVGFMNTNTE